MEDYSVMCVPVKRNPFVRALSQRNKADKRTRGRRGALTLAAPCPQRRSQRMLDGLPVVLASPSADGDMIGGSES